MKHAPHSSSTRNTAPRPATLLLLALAAALPGAEPAPTPAGARPWVISNGQQTSDLYWHGELTDSAGRRWDIGFIPGMARIGASAANSWSRSLDYVDDCARAGGATEACLRYAGETVLVDGVIRGIGRDAGRASQNIAEAWQEKPFGWHVIVPAEAFWGFIAKPVARVVVGVVVSAAAGSAGVCIGAGGGAVGVGIGAADASLGGVAAPVLRTAWHHHAWAACLLNAEPLPTWNHRFGMRIIRASDAD
jgi:hypothetical protein